MATVLRLPQVIERIGMKRTAIYAAIAEGRFPAPIKLGARAVGWIADDIDRWIASRAKSPAQLRAEAEALIAHAARMEAEGK